ncbi:MAG: endonuclease/exonuclease/phosphatase family protein [Kiritimatiellia bacterium]|jgi:endonuclease/exonuclease/phosphatase family metal-dependent hydrolase|nr:endonuclease/exonuclease/phosphatase family protein [Kiritimatiellia bacterium]
MVRGTRRVLLSGAAVAWLLRIGAFAAEPAPLVVASWNVENLFDTEDDPANEGDDGFTPRGWMRWTGERYRLKLDHLAEIIARMRPDVLCLTEVENRRVLEDLARTLERQHAFGLPVIVHRDAEEKRGIDVALLARTAPDATRWLRTAPGQREVLVCDFSFGGRRLAVLVNHWKSQLGKKAESDEIRRREARAVRAFLDERLRAEPAAAILVAGDFNDAPESPVLTGDAGFVTEEARVRGDASGRLLFNLAGSLSETARVTYYYAAGKKWNTMDAISVTRGMLAGAVPAAPWRVRQNGYTVFKTAAQQDPRGAPIPFRRVRNKKEGDFFRAGYSDHFPVRVELEPSAAP